MPPQMDAFSTPLNAAGGAYNGYNGGHMQINQNFGSSPGPGPQGGHFVSDGFLRNSKSNFNQAREGVIVNNRSQDGYY